MKNIIATTAAIAMMTVSGCAVAQQSTSVQANVTAVYPLQAKVSDVTYQQVCENVQVPVYENRRQHRQTNSGDALLGAIIGGAVGNQFGKGSGKDAMTVLGAIVGADAATNRNSYSDYQVVTGYRNETVCQNKAVPTTRLVNQGYEVSYEWNGLTGTLMTNSRYNVGDTILVNVTIN